MRKDLAAFRRKLLRNVDARTVADLAAELGLDFEIQRPRGRGHPHAIVGRGDRTVRITLGSSPSARTHAAQVRAGAMAKLREAGLVKSSCS